MSLLSLLLAVLVSLAFAACAVWFLRMEFGYAEPITDVFRPDVS